ncbi:MAG: hypothetical protein ACJA09_001318 [Alcanivorax sp.]
MGNVIAIGALGGSGTRAIAQVLIEAGIYMGDDLNQPNDNLIFTRLFKDPIFYKSASKADINERLDVFKAYMERNHLTAHGADILNRAAKENPTFKSNEDLNVNILQKLSNLPTQREFWGWKEPNTQIYIEEASNFFESFKYIHVVRHGLDMAFSKNKQQLVNWGFKYDIHLDGNEKEDEIAYKQLEYWIKSTEDSMKKGARLGSNFLLISHSRFCNDPHAQVDRIIDFAGLEIKQEKRSELYQIPKQTSTVGRHKKYSVDIFDKRQIDFVRQLDFEV